MTVITDNDQNKSFFYNLIGMLLLLGGIGYNIFTISLLQRYHVLPVLESHIPHQEDFYSYLPLCSSVLMLGIGLLMWFAPRKISWYFNESILFNIFLLTGLFALLFTSNVVAPGHYRLVRVFLVLLLMFTLTNAFYQLAVKDQKRNPLHPYWRNMILLFFSVLMVSLFLEMVFMFVARPHRYNGSLASRNWFAKYWTVNANGFRDADFSAEDLKKKKVVLFAGDSFTAAHGVKNPSDRFSDLVGKKLPEGFVSVNLGYPGADTRQEFKYVSEFPVVPAVMVLQWYPNDMDEAGKSSGIELVRVEPYQDVPRILEMFIKRSYLANFLYWLYPRKSEFVGYLGFLNKCFTSQKAMDAHRQDLGQFVSYSREKEIPLVVVVFPFVDFQKGSEPAVKQVEEFFGSLDVPVISVTQAIQGMDPASLIVNKNDGHPNEFLHRLVADSVLAVITRQGWLK